MTKLEEFLSEYKSEETAKTVKLRLQKFLDWYGKNPESLSELSNKEAKSLLLKFQKAMVDKGVPNNSILAYVSSTKTFLEYLEIVVRFRKGQLVNAEKAEGYHNYSNGDLGSMFEVANVQYKALISLASSCGFSIADILKLEKDFVKAHIERAKQQKERFVFIEQTRKKTNSKALLVINPLALEWLEKWIVQNPKSKLFTAHEDAINVMLRKLAKRSGITLSGKIRFHNIRSWLMNSLSKAGFNEFAIKYCVGKKIPLSDETYLNLKQQVIEKIPQIYERYLNIKPEGKIITDTEAKSLLEAKDREIQALRQAYQSLQTQVTSMSDTVAMLVTDYNKRKPKPHEQIR